MLLLVLVLLLLLLLLLVLILVLILLLLLLNLFELFEQLLHIQVIVFALLVVGIVAQRVFITFESRLAVLHRLVDFVVLDRLLAKPDLCVCQVVIALGKLVGVGLRLGKLLKLSHGVGVFLLAT